MPYQKHYKLVDDVTSHFDAVTATIDGFTLSRYVGFFAVASAAVIESAYKDIVLDFAERTHPTFSSYFASRHEQVNGRVKISQINEDCLKRFGGAFHKRFNSLLTRVDRYYIKQKGFSIVSSYGSLITCRHEFAHQGSIPETASYNDIKNGYEAGKVVLSCLAKALNSP